jgi:hypothetical protein
MLSADNMLSVVHILSFICYSLLTVCYPMTLDIILSPGLCELYVIIYWVQQV